MYCGRKAGSREDCIAIQFHCIVTRQGTWPGLYCNTATASTTRRASAGLGAQAAGARGRAVGATRASRRRRQAGARGARGRKERGARQVRGARQAPGARGARPAGRPGRGLGVLLGYALGALSLFLARFDSVLFLSQFLDIVREPGS